MSWRDYVTNLNFVCEQTDDAQTTGKIHGNYLAEFFVHKPQVHLTLKCSVKNKRPLRLIHLAYLHRFSCFIEASNILSLSYLLLLQTGFPTPDDEGFENDWLNSFLDDPVLNDRMMTDAMQPPLIKSEHSYSINDNEPTSPLQLQNQEGVLFLCQSYHWLYVYGNS